MLSCLIFERSAARSGRRPSRLAEDGQVRAVVLEQFRVQPVVCDVPEPSPAEDGVVVRVEATGLCRSDWHAFAGHDDDVRLPLIPGHELAGTVLEVGAAVRRWHPGQRVTVPFVCACGTCGICRSGQQQVCERQEQPGFTHPGSYAEQVALRYADTNLVELPDELPAVDAAGLGCRLATAWHALVDVARVRAGEWVVVHGCGGAGLAILMVARAAGAQVVAVDLSPDALGLALELGAAAGLDPAAVPDVPAAVAELTGGGAHVSVDAAGTPATLDAGLRCLRRRGTHVQVGLLPARTGRPAVPMDLVVARELRILGSHGMAARSYPALLSAVRSGALDPAQLVRRRITLDEAPGALAALGSGSTPGITVIEPGAG